MHVFAEFLDKIDNPEHRGRVEAVLRWVSERFPDLEARVAWNQPMFTHHGTFIIGFSLAKQHMAVAPEQVAVERFAQDFIRLGYSHTKQLVRMPWSSEMDYDLLERIIAFNIADKAECQTFWRK